MPLGKIDAGPVVQALLEAKPDAIFSSLFAGDLAKFVREGELRGLFHDRPVFNLLAGEPEYLDPLKDEAPLGWYVTGYPWYAIDTARAPAFPRRLSGALQRLSARGLGRRLQRSDERRGGDAQGEVDRHRKARRRDGRAGRRHAVRRGDLPRARPPVHHGRLRRPPRGQGRQGRDGRLASMPTARPTCPATTGCVRIGRPTSRTACGRPVRGRLR